jgi:serine protease Do
MSTVDMDQDLSGLARLVTTWTVEITCRDGEGRGSGVIWHPDGLLATNAHVVTAPRHIVRLADGRELEGRVLVRDERRDVALLDVEMPLPTLPIGDPGALRPGSLVLALGHPWGVTNALSMGVVHAVSRDRRGAPRYIAADVRLAPGNSGGPLVDAAGRVIGMNAMIVGGLGVAIPVNVIGRVVRDAIAAGAIPQHLDWAA